MSKFNLSRANEALKRTAEIAKNGTAQQRSGRFRTPLEAINERLIVEVRSALKSWAFVETSFVFNKNKNRFSLVEQTFRPDITPVFYMNITNAWREALMVFFRLTDQAEPHGQTFPAFLKEYGKMDFPTYAKENHRVSFLALGLQNKWDDHFAKCCKIAEQLQKDCYQKFSDIETGQGVKLGGLREPLKDALRIRYMSHAKESAPVPIADYIKEARQAMIFIASFADATEFITYGYHADMKSYFKRQCKDAHLYWTMCDKHISEI